MPNSIILKRSNVPGNVPSTSNVSAGELAINTADERIFFGATGSVVEVMTHNNVVPLDHASFTSGTLTISDTSTHVLDSVPTSDVRSLDYIIQASSSEGYHVVKFLIIHDGTTAVSEVYGGKNVGSIIIDTLDASITSGTLNVTIKAHYSDVTYIFSRTILSV